MLYVLIGFVILTAGAAAFLLWQVQRDFFTAVKAEYAEQFSRDPDYKKQMRQRARPRGERLKRSLRKLLFQAKRPIYLLARAIGARR